MKTDNYKYRKKYIDRHREKMKREGFVYTSLWIHKKDLGVVQRLQAQMGVSRTRVITFAIALANKKFGIKEGDKQ